MITPKTFQALSLVALAVSCGSAGPRELFPITLQPMRFSAEIGEEHVASAGDSIFVHGQVGQRPAFKMSSGIVSTMPGAYGVPFDFSIEACTLTGVFQTAKHEYYGAPFERSDAHHSLAGKVIKPGDTVGLRISRTTGEKEWYVDNSQFNRMTTIWHRRVLTEDGVTFSPTESGVVDGASNLTSIIYGGFYSGLLHFTLREVEQGEAVENEFKFDVLTDRNTPVNIKGNVFEVLSVDNFGMLYRWMLVAE